MEERATELSTYLRGWRGYFGFCQTPSVLTRLDKWLRHRLRSAMWKQWKRGNKRFAALRKRGIGLDLAAKTAGSPHGPGQLADSPALHYAFPNSYFDSLGLLRLTGGSQLHSPNRRVRTRTHDDVAGKAGDRLPLQIGPIMLSCSPLHRGRSTRRLTSAFRRLSSIPGHLPAICRALAPSRAHERRPIRNTSRCN